MKLNHVLVRTRDLDETGRFFADIIGLEAGQRPPFRFKGAWFYSEGRPLIHVVEDRKGRLDDSGPLAHVALEGVNYDALLERLNESKTRYSEKDVPLSGERQVFISGPDALMIEILFPIGVAHDEGRPYDGAT